MPSALLVKLVGGLAVREQQAEEILVAVLRRVADGVLAPGTPGKEHASQLGVLAQDGNVQGGPVCAAKGLELRGRALRIGV